MKEKILLIQQNLSHIQQSYAKEDFEKYGKDWASFYTPNPLVVLFPKNTKEVQEIVLFANKYQMPIVPSGGRTGLSGGAVAQNLEMVVSMEKMNKIVSFNEINQTIEVEAGVITEEIQQFANRKDLFYAVDFASKGSSQIGGNIATNAGGIKVLRYGLTRNYVLGLTFVTAKGEVLELNHGLIKNASGYDLRHLIIGSEGTLGVVTQATIQLIKKPMNLTVLFLAIHEIKNILQVLQSVKTHLEITAFEFLSNNALHYFLQENEGTKPPFASTSDYYVLIEFENKSGKDIEVVGKLVADFYEKGWVENDLIAQESNEIKRIWQYRECITESVAKYTPYKNDISVLPSSLPSFVAEAEGVLYREYPNIEILWFGHIADGNLHINILKPKGLSVAEFHEMGNKISPILFKRIKEYKGSISAEHGIGLLKQKFVGFSKSEKEIDYLKAIKKVFDPNNIMNPGKMI